MVGGIVIPLYKKGNSNDTNKYRGITLISCLEMIFTAVLNTRLLKWLEENDIVTNAQFGFKPGCGTTDAIFFALQTVITKTLGNKTELYCCFIDYRKAFDSINRTKRLYTLARSGISGQIYTIIKSTYNSLNT